mmetsp:Transcript_2135/g.3853  ORF Transcript_2135/g.3853 Transcript_2135/m.3853 type:complete len:82 (+) Transcript_2135:438-683(+)
MDLSLDIVAFWDSHVPNRDLLPKSHSSGVSPLHLPPPQILPWNPASNEFETDRAPMLETLDEREHESFRIINISRSGTSER